MSGNIDRGEHFDPPIQQQIHVHGGHHGRRTVLKTLNTDSPRQRRRIRPETIRYWTLPLIEGFADLLEILQAFGLIG